MDDLKQDTSCAMAYLGGFHEKDKRGIPRQRFYSEASAEASFCRAALARVLRSERPLDRQLREMLATMFEPNPEIGSLWSERKLCVRRRKKPKDHMANTHMAWFVWERVRAGTNVERAIDQAMDQFNVSRERMYDLWKAYKSQFAMIWGPIDS